MAPRVSQVSDLSRGHWVGMEGWFSLPGLPGEASDLLCSHLHGQSSLSADLTRTADQALGPLKEVKDRI